MEPIPEVFEDHPTLVTLPTTQTGEGNVASLALAEEVGDTFPVRDVSFRPPGDWLAYAIRDENGEWVATRLATPREGDGLPSLLALEAASAATAEPVTVMGPREPYEDNDSGIFYYPPLEVSVRGERGLYLHQRIEKDIEPPATGVPVCTLVWREGEVYWRLSGICDSSPQGRYDLFTLMDAARTMVEYDAQSGQWVELQ